MSLDPAEEVIRLVTAPNPAQAHIWEEALRAEGIRCKVVGDYLNASFGNIPGLLPEIWVHQQDQARAEEVLRALSASQSEEEKEGPVDDMGTKPL